MHLNTVNGISNINAMRICIKVIRQFVRISVKNLGYNVKIDIDDMVHGSIWNNGTISKIS